MKKVRDIGEIKLIENFMAIYKSSAHTIVGIGDDAAVIQGTARNKSILFTCDTLVEGIHFPKNFRCGYSIGWKALGAGLSDIAAMGGTPVSALVSLAVPSSARIDFIEDLIKGIESLAGRFSVDISGGDTVSSPHGIVITVSVIGTVNRGKEVKRSGARCGDKILVTGRLGGSIYGKQFNFIPRIKEAQWLVKHGRIHAMMDITDGLSLDLFRLVTASESGAVLYEESIPISKDAFKTTNPLESALSDGEDFELLAVTSDHEKLLKKWKNKKVPLTLIGEITKNTRKIELLDKKGKRTRLAPHGYEHFK